MTEGPPFAPPYRTIVKTATGVIVTETAADGTKRELGEVALSSLHATDDQISTIQRSRKKPAPVTTTTFASGKATTYLDVPFADKDKAKSKGAKWDSTKKKWYVPHGSDINVFKSWWPETLK